MKTYIFAATKPWNYEAFIARRADLPGEWLCVTNERDLTGELIARLKPRYVFFPHWSMKVPQQVLDSAECVCFHMTDVPFGRGGSPLQNLILRGIAETKVTALRMTAEMDAGPVYAKQPLSLNGSAQEIFRHASEIVLDLIESIVASEPTPVAQQGVPTVFKRRKAADSLLPVEGSLRRLYDHIRMLDAETYPAAFLDHGDFRLMFTDAKLGDDALTAKVRIVPKEKA